MDAAARDGLDVVNVPLVRINGFVADTADTFVALKDNERIYILDVHGVNARATTGYVLTTFLAVFLSPSAGVLKARLSVVLSPLPLVARVSLMPLTHVRSPHFGVLRLPRPHVGVPLGTMRTLPLGEGLTFAVLAA
jgi:hypothetical protein